STSSEAADAIRSDFFCGDANSEALVEASRREASVALELVTKAVIAQRVENGTADMHVGSVPMTHNLPTLWANAKLPKLAKDDKGRLLKAKYILLWTGRYPAPKTDEDFERMRSELNAYKVITGRFAASRRPRTSVSRGMISTEFTKSRPIPFGLSFRTL